jgi:hypothetical protein
MKTSLMALGIQIGYSIVEFWIVIVAIVGYFVDLQPAWQLSIAVTDFIGI